MGSAIYVSEAEDDSHVTASNLVRNFGVWQERAARSPIYVLHRGRPRLVLTSAELMRQLCDTRSSDGIDLMERNLILDALDTPAIRVDGERMLLHANRPARARFSLNDEYHGRALHQIAGVIGAALDDAARHALRSGMEQRLSILDADRDNGSEFSALVTPIASGALILLRDQSVLQTALAAKSAERAVRDAVTGIGTELATAELNARAAIWQLPAHRLNA